MESGRPTGLMSKPIEIEWSALMTSRLDAELLPQANVQAVGQHDQSRRNLVAVRQRDGLPVGAGRDIAVDLGLDEFGVRDGICARTVLTSVS